MGGNTKENLGQRVTGADGRNQYWLADKAVVESPMVVEGFQVDNDVIVLSGLGLSRADLKIEQRDGDTVISIPGRAAGRSEATVPVAILRGVHAADLDPAPLVKELCAALAANSAEKVTSLLADDVVWEAPGPTDFMPWAGGYHGPAEVKEYLKKRAEILDIDRFEVQSIIAQGDTVCVILQEHGRAKKSGVEFDGGVVIWATVAGGKLKLVQFYLDTYPILEAIKGGRPFTVEPNPNAYHYVAKPLPSKMTSDNFIFDADELENPPQTVKTVRQMYAALQGLNVEKLQVVFAPDVLWEIFGPPDMLSWAGPVYGPEAAAESARQIIATMHFDHFKPTRLICEGKTAAISIDEGGTSTATGKDFKTSVVHIVTTNDEGQVVLFRNYINTAEIVEAFLGGRPYTVRKP